MVRVVVGEKHPPHIGRVHDGEDLVQPTVSVDERPGVDDHRLSRLDHHRVQAEEADRRRRHELGHHIRAVGDSVRLDGPGDVDVVGEGHGCSFSLHQAGCTDPDALAAQLLLLMDGAFVASLFRSASPAGHVGPAAAAVITSATRRRA